VLLEAFVLFGQAPKKFAVSDRAAPAVSEPIFQQRVAECPPQIEYSHHSWRKSAYWSNWELAALDNHILTGLTLI